MNQTKKDLYYLFEGVREKYLECEKETNAQLKNIENSNIHKMDFSDNIRIINQQLKTAQNKFTIATIGEFKAGKSTTLNTILNLHGNNGLSCQFEPDTAKAIRIIRKLENQEYDAEIIFKEESGYQKEKLSWSEAKKYTSQVELNSNPSLKRKADAIDEVRYYVDSDLLNDCNFLDLPGTGFDPKHNRITETKINESDAVFWILSNTEEPNKETVKNLQMIKHKIIPIINLWYNPETGEEVGDLSYDEVKDTLLDNCKAYLGDNEIFKYNAKAIEKIQLEDEDMPDEDLWGYQRMKEYLYQLIYGEGKDLESEKKKRMIENTLESCAFMDKMLEDMKNEVDKFSSQLNLEKRENQLIKRKLDNAYNNNQGELKGIASNSVDDIISRMNEACELFVEDKMTTYSVKTIFKSITKDGRAEIEEQFRKEYIHKYLEIDETENNSSWISALMSDYLDNVNTVFISEYSNIDIDIDDMPDAQSSEVVLDPSFFASIGENMSIAMKQNMREMMPIIISEILVIIPGHEILDILLLFGSLGKKLIGDHEAKLPKRVDNVKRRARLSISFQRSKLIDKFKETGKKHNIALKKDLESKLKVRMDDRDKVYEAVKYILQSKNDVAEYMKSVKSELENIGN